ncbi:MAG: glycosyltransferase, partial [Proteobacteria bacterium]|nr:glycosyltransferase [Pseudomonadota bacterium]
VGFLTKLRGLDLLIRAVDEFVRVKDGGKSIKVDIVGNGAEKENLIALVKDLAIEDIVRIHGWLEQEEVNALLKKSNVGALTYRVCSHWNHTIPNKIFDYMKAGLPIIATNVMPIARILQKTKSGIFGDEKQILRL